MKRLVQGKKRRVLGMKWAVITWQRDIKELSEIGGVAFFKYADQM